MKKIRFERHFLTADLNKALRKRKKGQFKTLTDDPFVEPFNVTLFTRAWCLRRIIQFI